CGGHHRDRFVERLQKTWYHTLRACRSHVPTAVLHNPGWPQKGDRQRQRAKSLLNDRVLGQEVGLGGLRTNRGKVNDPRRGRGIERVSQSHGDPLSLGKPGCRVKTRGHEHEDAFRSSKRGRQRGRILDRRQRDLTTTVRPRPTFASVPYDSPDWLIGGEKDAADDPSDLAGNSHDCIHSWYSFVCLMECDRTTCNSSA